MRDIPTSPRIIQIRHKRRVKRIRLGILFFILIVSLIWALSFFSNDKHIVIDKVSINGTHIINQEEIKENIFRDIG